ncbi:hypothetical protein BN8_06450 [Fibrisoma limi BUZ 3]|uniref:Secretion system C-terminal sorting domain-containing protein n=1 Tax=Fibrisoma limi BUZ 3 TaxID=1185876 RepID=I2GT22_9BACT|nr:hypothetical protein [Fibrisoma limi]CCH57051.1 hypothetical protein BN8_06450 [Fibrisoma limi BUZ 3]
MFNLLFHTSALAGAKSLIAAVLLSSTTLTAEPTEPKKPMSFNASVYVNKENKIHLAVQKVATQPVQVILRNKHQDVLYMQTIGKKEEKVAIRFNVSDLEDGMYELEIKSNDGSIRRQLNIETPGTKPSRTITME